MFYRLIISAVILFASPALAAESNMNRAGADYRSFWLNQPDYRQCERACSGDAKCKAWTFVKPNVQGSRAKCWLKHSITAARASNCCISGVTRRPTGITTNQSRQAQESAPASLADPRSWINSACAVAYRIYIHTTQGHVRGGRRKGVFVAGYDPKTRKYHCFVANTYGYIVQTERSEIARCRRNAKLRRSSCRTLGYWRYQ